MPSEAGVCSSSPAPGAGAPRGWRRRNYLDEDAYYGLSSSSKPLSPPHHSQSGPSSRSISQPHRLSYTQSAVLRGLWHPYVGRGLSLLLSGAAYAAYLGGSYPCLLRHSPLTSSGPPSSEGAASLYVGKSSIHGRGVFTATDLPRGTALPLDPMNTRCFLTAPTYLMLLSDVVEQRLPDVLHYTHPSGRLLEYLTPPGRRPHHALMNHSCSPCVTSGLSSCFWSAARAADDVLLFRQQQESMMPARRTPVASPVAVPPSVVLWRERMTWPGFHNPNAYFLTRDVKAHEELTISYEACTAPLYACASAATTTQRGRRRRRRRHQSLSLLTERCRCGAQNCRLWVRGGVRSSAASSTAARREEEDEEAVISRSCPGGYSSDDWKAAVRGLSAGMTNEVALLSLLPTPAPLLAYLQGRPPLPCHEDTNTASLVLPPLITSTAVRKSDFLLSYRSVIEHMNRVGPTEKPLPSPGE